MTNHDHRGWWVESILIFVFVTLFIPERKRPLLSSRKVSLFFKKQEAVLLKFLWCFLVISGHFNEVLIWISEVQRGDCPHRSCPLHRALLDLHSTRLQTRQRQKLGEISQTTTYVKNNSVWQVDRTLKCAATVVRGVLVTRHKSAEPGVGCLALGSNSLPSWWRLNFCFPKIRALRSPSIGEAEMACVSQERCPK